MSNDADSQDVGWVTTFVFISGFIVGAAAAILIAPESGSSLRGRLAKGAKTAQEELADVAQETKEAFRIISDDTQRTVKHAATRLTEVMDATKEAMGNPQEGDSPSSRPQY